MIQPLAEVHRLVEQLIPENMRDRKMLARLGLPLTSPGYMLPIGTEKCAEDLACFENFFVKRGARRKKDWGSMEFASMHSRPICEFHRREEFYHWAANTHLQEEESLARTIHK